MALDWKYTTEILEEEIAIRERAEGVNSLAVIFLRQAAYLGERLEAIAEILEGMASDIDLTEKHTRIYEPE